MKKDLETSSDTASGPITTGDQRPAIAVGREEFLARFKAELIRSVGEKSDDGEDVGAYADDIGPTYWDEPQQRAWGPEECAHVDLSYWGEE